MSKNGIKHSDLTDRRFGKLLVLCKNKDSKQSSRVVWLCKCDCGNKIEVIATKLLYCRKLSCNDCSRGKYNIIGKRFGRLTVIDLDKSYRSGTKQKISYLVKCRCDCGKVVIRRKSNLYNGCTTSCGCYRNEITSLPNGLAAINRIFYSYKANAEKRNLIFMLSLEEFLDITSKDCIYCGRKPSNIVKNKFGHGNFIYNGIDRIDSKKGYIKDNCSPCCKICNVAKNTMTENEFIKWITLVYDNFAYKHRCIEGCC